MKNATLAQGNQVLNLILQKKVPTKQLQELLGSGLLSDLFDANVAMVNRVEFRRMIGLTAFSTWRTIRRTLVSPEDATVKLEAAGHKISDWAGIILPKVVFDGDGEYELVVASNADLGLTGNSIKLLETYAHAEGRFGLELCPAWVGPQLRLDYTGQPLGERLVIAMEAISDSGGLLYVFDVGRDGSGSRLSTNFGRPVHCDDAGRRFVFVRRKPARTA